MTFFSRSTRSFLFLLLAIILNSSNSRFINFRQPLKPKVQITNGSNQSLSTGKPESSNPEEDITGSSRRLHILPELHGAHTNDGIFTQGEDFKYLMVASLALLSFSSTCIILFIYRACLNRKRGSSDQQVLNGTSKQFGNQEMIQKYIFGSKSPSNFDDIFNDQEEEEDSDPASSECQEGREKDITGKRQSLGVDYNLARKFRKSKKPDTSSLSRNTVVNELLEARKQGRVYNGDYWGEKNSSGLSWPFEGSQYSISNISGFTYNYKRRDLINKATFGSDNIAKRPHFVDDSEVSSQRERSLSQS